MGHKSHDQNLEEESFLGDVTNVIILSRKVSELWAFFAHNPETVRDIVYKFMACVVLPPGGYSNVIA